MGARTRNKQPAGKAMQRTVGMEKVYHLHRDTALGATRRLKIRKRGRYVFGIKRRNTVRRKHRNGCTQILWLASRIYRGIYKKKTVDAGGNGGNSKNH